ILAPGASPFSPPPAPVPAINSAMVVPWPLSSSVALCAKDSGTSSASTWPLSEGVSGLTPVSITATLTPSPVLTFHISSAFIAERYHCLDCTSAATAPVVNPVDSRATAPSTEQMPAPHLLCCLREAGGTFPPANRLTLDTMLLPVPCPSGQSDADASRRLWRRERPEPEFRSFGAPRCAAGSSDERPLFLEPTPLPVGAPTTPSELPTGRRADCLPFPVDVGAPITPC